MLSHGFTKVNQINGTKKISDILLHVYSPAGLIQAAGYLKYQLGRKNSGLVFRGQSDLYENKLKPSLYREIKTPQSVTLKQEDLCNIITQSENDFSKTFEQYSGVKPQFVRPLLQHYGLKTEWLDVVDNIWIALWFACYEALSVKNVPYMILRRRSEKSEKIGIMESLEKLGNDCCCRYSELRDVKNEKSAIVETDYTPQKYKRKIAELKRRECNLDKEIEKLEEEKNKLNSKLEDNSYAYILMVRYPGNLGECYGIWKDRNTELYDLRYCLPSTFLRPHAQHGMVIRKLSNSGRSTSLDYSTLLEGVLRIDLNDALSWLGDSILLSPGTLFPSPVNDHGLQQLLKSKTLRPYLQISTP